MKTALLLLALFIAFPAMAARNQVDLENQMRDRLYNLVARVDPSALIQPKVTVKKVSSSLPGLGFDAKVVPLDYDGDLGTSGVESISIRIITRSDTFPQWMKDEVAKAAAIDGVKVTITYEKAQGDISEPKAEIAKAFSEATGPALEAIQQVRTGVWALTAGLAGFLALIAFTIYSFSDRLEKTFAKLMDEKVVPALQERGGGGANIAQMAEAAKSDPSKSAASSSGVDRELAGIPESILIALLNDCYWTSCDRYAHYLWTQMSSAQKEKVIDSGKIDFEYFTFFRRYEPENLGYHNDARYMLLKNEFAQINQKDLAKWLGTNQKFASKVSPLRWDFLPIALQDRVKLTPFRQTTEEKLAAAPSAEKSAKRELPASLELKTFTPDDEIYVWKNHQTIPEPIRASLRTLVWLALAPQDYRAKVFGDLDARQIAEAWLGPKEVLEKLREVIPAKKMEMAEHFMKDIRADRNGSVFNYLFEAGLRAPKSDVKEVKAA